jgi:thioredoxin-dependent peroxiredoxin
MSQITLQGNTINTVGILPEIGSTAKEFTLVDEHLATKNLDHYAGRTIILNIFPSVDTGVCAKSVREFNKVAGGMENTIVLCISKDLPFAHARFCGAEGLVNVTSLSDFRSGDFGNDYGLTMVDGPLAGLLARAVVIIKKGVVTYTELVPEITQEPNYEKALASL